MATAKKKAAAKKPAAKQPAAKKSTKQASDKPAAKAAPATKVPKKKAPKKSVEKKPSLGKTVNMGPLRGDNSFPPGNKPLSKDRSRAPVMKAHGSPANDSTRGPGGQGLQAKKQGQKGGGKDD